MRSRTIHLDLLILTFVFCFCSPGFSEQTEKEFLDMIPGGEIDFAMIVDLGYRYSDSAALVKANLKTKEILALQAKATETSTLGGAVSQSANRNEQANPFAAQILSARQISTNWQTNLDTGTSFRAEVSSNQTDLRFTTPGTPPIPEYESRLSFSLRQSLWRNGFGKNQNAVKEAANSRSSSINASFASELGSWLLNLHNLYAEAWFAQKRVQFANERIKIQQRLLRIINVLRSRGTALETDSLNVRQTLMSQKKSADSSKLSLKELWHRLIILLKLPERFLELDPSKIPISLSSGDDLMQNYCKASDLSFAVSDDVPAHAALKQEIEALKLDSKRLVNETKPDLYLALSAGANDWDNEFSRTATRTVGFKHPDYLISLGVEVDMRQNIRDVEYLQNSLNLQRSELQLSSIKAEARIQWTNACATVRSLLQDKEQLEKIISLGKRRSRLEEERFALGKVTAETVIRASSELVANQEALALTEISLARSFWQLKDLKAEIPTFIKQAVANSRINPNE